jgi:ribonuclease BN (tRNA processing enzyme)
MLTVNFHGVRGSHPVADAEMVKYGGNTACVEIVKTNRKGLKVPLILDGGSGIIKFGYNLTDKLFSGEYSKTFPWLFTHLHPDHTEGFNFFLPVFFNFCTLHIMGMATMLGSPESVLKTQVMPPGFPIEYRNLKSQMFYRVLKDGETFFIDQNGEPQNQTDDPLFEIRVLQAYAPSHPLQGATYYRVSDPDDGSSVVCVWDIESHPGGDLRVINLSRNADVMIHDTQYTDEEYLNEKATVQGFGHSTYAMALENAEKAGVKNLFTFHYNPRHNDRFLDKIAKQYARKKHPFDFYMSYEGLSLTLDKGKLTKNDDLQLSFAKK